MKFLFFFFFRPFLFSFGILVSTMLWCIDYFYMSNKLSSCYSFFFLLFSLILLLPSFLVSSEIFFAFFLGEELPTIKVQSSPTGSPFS